MTFQNEFETSRASRYVKGSLAAALLLGSAWPAFAQSASDGDIVVTARKRDEKLIDVPVAVTALSASDLEKYNASDLSKIGQLAPQVIIAKTGGGGNGAVLAIRGISSSTTDTGLSSTVSVNLDGTQISRGRLTTQGFFDLQQVEVLKGPQALYFGKNSPGGVISLKSAGATKQMEGYVRGGYEFNAKEKYLEAALSGPISDTLGFRVAGRATDMEGWMKDTSGPYTQASNPLFPHPGFPDSHAPKSREYLARITLDWQPTDRFSAVLKVFGSRYNDNGPDGTSEVKCANPNDLPQTLDYTTFALSPDPYGDCKINGKNSNTSLHPTLAAAMDTARNGDPYTRHRSILSSLTATYDADSFSLTSVTSYYKFRSLTFDNFDFTAIGSEYSSIGQRNSAFSQELRLRTNLEGPVNGMIGGYYESEKNPFRNVVQLNQLGIDPVSGKYQDWELIFKSNAKTYSVFGQVDYDITEQLQLSAGARYTREEKKQLGVNEYVKPAFQAFWTFVQGVPLILPEGQEVSGKLTNDNVSPEVTLTYHPTEQSTLYGAFKTGFKSGGFSQPGVFSPAFAANPDSLKFAPEKVKGFEVGAKGEFFDRRLRLTSAAYTYKFRDLQVQTFDPATISYQVGNAASARTTGVEIEGNYVLTSALSVHAAIAYNKAKYLDYTNAPCYAGQTLANGCVSASLGQDLSGERLHRAPEWTLSSGFSYDRPLTDGLNFGLASDVAFNSSYNVQDTQNPIAKQSGYALWNASIRLHQPEDRWEVALIGRNLTDKLVMAASIDKPFGPPGQIVAGVMRGREVALQGVLRF